MNLNFEYNKQKILQRILNRINPLVQRVTPEMKSVAIVSFFLFFSRFLGFCRGLIIYQRMDQVSSDLLYTSISIPDVISFFLILGTIANSVLPVASRIQKRDQVQSLHYINLITLTLTLVLGLLISIVFIFTEGILLRFTSPQVWQDFADAGLIQDYINITRILLLMPLFFSAQSVLGVFLTIKKRFFVYSLSGLLYNLGTIFGLLLTNPTNYYLVAWGMVLGSLLGLSVFLVESYRFGLKPPLQSLRYFKHNFRQVKKELIQTWAYFLPRMLTIPGMLVATLLIKNVATGANGSISAFEYGTSIQNAFLTVIMSMGAVFFPDLARLLSKDKQDTQTLAFWRKLWLFGLYTALFAFLGSVFVFIIGAWFVVFLFEIFGKGQDNADMIILVAKISSIGFVFQALAESLSKYFYVKENFWHPFIIDNLAVVVQVVITYSLVYQKQDVLVAVTSGMITNYIIRGFTYILVIWKDYQKQHKQFDRNFTKLKI